MPSWPKPMAGRWTCPSRRCSPASSRDASRPLPLTAREKTRGPRAARHMQLAERPVCHGQSILPSRVAPMPCPCAVGTAGLHAVSVAACLRRRMNIFTLSPSRPQSSSATARGCTSLAQPVSTAATHFASFCIAGTCLRGVTASSRRCGAIVFRYRAWLHSLAQPVATAATRFALFGNAAAPCAKHNGRLAGDRWRGQGWGLTTPRPAGRRGSCRRPAPAGRSR